ncbi:MarR family winged helix-turn-helix transcriptional regulator [Sporolactobacillus sp. KGMB 08714]|uniref:MarR family winged helix-turn-helix transcriptional regulator n=1 Tax=Sporolactobacillus sp. KGMB 08714 TaxID=3064704 RepID=UPI002FBDA79F
MKNDQNLMEIIETYYQLLNLDSDSDKEKRWMAEHVSFKWPRLTTLHMHVLAYIYTHPDTNGKSICCALNILPGTLSKITNRLKEEKLVDIAQEMNDKRGRVYRATARGNEVSTVHEGLHKIKDARLEDMLLEFSADELRIIKKFLDRILQVELKKY